MTNESYRSRHPLKENESKKRRKPSALSESKKRRKPTKGSVLFKGENIMMKELFRFDTQKERDFIDGLGTFTLVQELAKKELLSLYIDSAKKRTHWDNVDPFLVIQHAKDRLKECE
tara:strand:- start:1057 stop:1404 length:348 start_codon:yes stop_codon:yes gene_type:complete